MTQVDRFVHATPSGTRSLSLLSSSTAQPRVLRVMTQLHVGGPARQALYLTEEMPRRGFDARLVWGAADRGSFDPPASMPATYLPYLQGPLSLGADLRTFRALDGLIGRWRPQIVHTHLTKAGAIARLAAHRRRVPVIVHTFHEAGPQGHAEPLVDRAITEMERRLATRSDALLAPSFQVRDDLLALGIGRSRQWHVVPVGVDLDWLVRHRPARATARAALDLPIEGPIVGCVGRLVPIRDHEVLLQAAARLLRERPDVTFVLAGDGEMRPQLRTRARELMGDRCVFLGWVHDLPTFYAAVDVVALTSKLEGTPIPLIEAAAAGKPVVATRGGSVREVVRDGETGLLVAPRDPSALAASLLTLLEDPEGARRMGEEGTGWVQGRFSATRLADQLTELYTELLARKRGR